MRTTLTIEEDVAVLIQRLRKERDLTLKEVVNQALRKGLNVMLAPPPESKRYRINPRDLGRCRLNDLDNISEALAIAEGEDYR
ncbi:MAG TPA: DUF2191 domain-containing protein [Acidobacteriota bacterium]|nr:DUF2191 domain-containing protein [Acidobacteriota bacterium]